MCFVNQGRALGIAWQKSLWVATATNYRSRVFQSFLALFLLAACASPPERVLSSIAPSYATLPNGHEPLNPTQPSLIYAAARAIPGDNLVRYLERKRGHALNVLSISGGGQNGAFGAGFL